MGHTIDPCSKAQMGLGIMGPYKKLYRKEVRKRKKSVPQKKVNVGSTTTLCTSLEKSYEGKLEKKTLRTMIEKSEREK